MVPHPCEMVQQRPPYLLSDEAIVATSLCRAKYPNPGHQPSRRVFLCAVEHWIHHLPPILDRYSLGDNPGRSPLPTAAQALKPERPFSDSKSRRGVEIVRWLAMKRFKRRFQSFLAICLFRADAGHHFDPPLGGVVILFSGSGLRFYFYTVG